MGQKWYYNMAETRKAAIGGFSKACKLATTNYLTESVMMKKTFWDRTANIYDRFMLKDNKAYKQMYALIYSVVRHKQEQEPEKAL